MINILKKKQIEQNTFKWYKKRHEIITASNVASIFDSNPYYSKLDLLKEKSNNITDSISNLATLWGQKYESIAFSIYEKLKNEKVYKVGLFIHDKYKWLGASPDGIRDNNKLLEIKCVWNRKVTTEIPKYYWIQVQIQMEVCNINECDLFQCKFIEYDSENDYLNDNVIFKGQLNNIYWKLDKYSLNTILRDKKWFDNNISSIYKFWLDIQYCKKNGYDKFIDTVKNYSDIIINTSSKRLKTEKQYNYFNEDWTQWINATDIKNYIINDPIIDWFNLYALNENNKYQKDNDDEFNEYISKKEYEFINNIFNKLEINENTVRIAHINEKFSINKYQETINKMISGCPIIIQGILHNRNNNTYAIPDLIIHLDYISKIIPNYIIKKPTNKSNILHHYRIINIKYNSLTLTKNNNIVNIGNIAGYKSETIISNMALENILGYCPDESYIIGKKYKDNIKTYNTFENIGVINVYNYDNKLTLKSLEAINWIRDLKKYGKNWDIYKPCRKELYPNMSNTFDYPWHNLKLDIAYKINEITLLWNCGIKERQLCHKNNIYNWQDVKMNIINFNGKKGDILEKIILTNTSTNLKQSTININKNGLNFFIDFETTNLYDNDDDNSFIYLIGIGYYDNEWIFKSFIVDRLIYDEEKRIIIEWLQYMKNIKTKYKCKKSNIYHWSQAEIIFSKKSFIRHSIPDINDNKIDMLELFKKNLITVKGAFNYGLKTIAKALYNNKIITTFWHDSSLNGISAIIVALNADKLCINGNITQLIQFDKMKDIIKYNEIDCKILWDIFDKLFINITHYS